MINVWLGPINPENVLCELLKTCCEVWHILTDETAVEARQWHQCRVNSGTWVSQQSAAWWKRSVRLLARLNRGTDPVNNVTQASFHRNRLCGHKERKPWSHGEEYTFESAVESCRGVSACECVCLLCDTQHNKEKELYHMFFYDIRKNLIFLQRKMKNNLNEGKQEAHSNICL